MGNRGSNIGKPVKEQRAYGDTLKWVRCALVALEKGRQLITSYGTTVTSLLRLS